MSADEGKNTDGGGKRFNENKTRYDLMPNMALKNVSDVFTFGAKKYGERNWQRGMKWTTMMASLERHLQAIKRGEDYDPESGLLHISHLLCNGMMLSEYYHIYPEGDDRIHTYNSSKKIGIDIDEVIADFMGAYSEYNSIDGEISHWSFDWEGIEKLKDYPEDFWLNIKPLIESKDMKFEPACYITSRHCSTETTEKWLKLHKFPVAPVYTVKPGESKLDKAKEAGIDVFVDDNYKTFSEFNNNGILCYLMTAPHNKKYDVGFKRIDNLDSII
jgi:5'(3')-deoxyribonucleotidase